MRVLSCLLFCSLVIPALAAEPAVTEKPQWIWLAKQNNETPARIQLRKSFTVDGEIKSAILAGTADNHLTAWLNGKQVLHADSWQALERSDVKPQLQSGKNLLTLEGKNDDGIAAAVAELRITLTDGRVLSVVTDTSWKASSSAPENWRAPDFDDSSWMAPVSLGEIGQKGLAWSGHITQSVLNSVLNSGTDGTFLPIVAENVTPREDFVVEQVFQVPSAMGSWVSLTKDNRGRLIASAQERQGLFLIVPGHDGEPTRVEKEPVEFSGAQGLCWAFDALYAVGSGTGGLGLHRLKDTNGDGLLDSDEMLMPLAGGGEHGPHAVILSPDGKSLHVIAGNHTKLPDGITGSRIPQNWGEDLLLPRRWDANGHAAGILAPGGWILKVDPDAKQREIVSIGYRNEYDIAFNADGELFTYDADMEWDLGSPWYRPTRICHATSGSEFGWRSGTGKWPAYYEDSLPPVVDIGPGSPVGVVFGTGAKFPAKYQRALFALDWTYSTIYAIHLTPEGSTYSGVKEEFLNGQPMQVTDAVVGDDGALYFAAGGRGTHSTLYRCRYTGNETTAPVDLKDPAGQEARDLRHRLEAMHGHPDGDLDFIFAHLGDDDRFIRYAARIALEAQPVKSWRDRALNGKLAPRAATLALLGLARQGTPEDLSRLLDALGRIPFAELDEQGQLALLRTYEVAFARMGAPDDAHRQQVIDRLNPLYPAPTYPLNAELVQLLVFLNAPDVVSKTLALMDQLGPEPIPDWGYLATRGGPYGGTVGKLLENMPPIRAIHFAFVLRNQKDGWTLPERERYFQFFIDASKFPGGNSFAKFLSQFREDAFATCTPAEQVALQGIASTSLLKAPPEVAAPAGPGRKWTRDEALANSDGALHGRNFEKGRNLFFATACAKCHRLNGEGGAIGPDLSTAGKKFPLPDLLDSIIEPSKVISDQYASQQVATTDGEVLQGRAVQIGDELHIFLPDANAAPRIFKMTDIEEIAPSKVSQMPVGLIDSLNPEELKDLLAYLVSGADPNAAVYKKK